MRGPHLRPGHACCRHSRDNMNQRRVAVRLRISLVHNISHCRPVGCHGDFRNGWGRKNLVECGNCCCRRQSLKVNGHRLHRKQNVLMDSGRPRTLCSLIICHDASTVATQDHTPSFHAGEPVLSNNRCGVILGAQYEDEQGQPLCVDHREGLHPWRLN